MSRLGTHARAHLRGAHPRGALAVLGAVSVVGCLLVAPLDESDPGGNAGLAANGGKAGKAGSGGVSATGGDGGTDVITAGAGAGGEAAGTGGVAARGGGSGTGGVAARGGSGGVAARGGTGGTEGPMAGAGGEPGCTTNAECVTLGAGVPYRCRESDQRCVQLSSSECPIVYGAFKDPNAIYVGSFAVLNPENPTENDVVFAEELAVDEINTQGGLPGGPDGAKRPLVLVVCTNNTAAVPKAIEVGMKHLANDVEVPAVLAMLKPDDLVTAFEQEFGKNIFYLSPVAVLRRIAEKSYDQFKIGNKSIGGLIWNLLGEPSDYAPAYALLLADLEAYLRAQRGLMESDKIKVALVNTSDEFNDELQRFVFQSLMLNGEDAALQEIAGNYRSIKIDLDAPDFDAVATQIHDFAPDIVISTAAEEMTDPDGIVQRIEDGWTGPAPRPYYILSPFNASSDAATTIKTIVNGEITSHSDDLAAQRFLGVSAASASNLTLQNGYATRFGMQHMGAPPDAAANTGNYYDAVYYLTYAMYGARADLGLTGPGIVTGMQRLLSGDPYDAEPTEIASVYAALDETDKTIALSGTLGPPDFDAETGVRPATPSVFCFFWDGTFVRQRLDTLRYDVDSQTFTGTYDCLTNFPP